MTFITANSVQVITPTRNFKFACLFLFYVLCMIYTPYVHADAPSGFRQQHPLGWIHDLPTGEQPGWSSNWWTNLEISNGNVWNAPLIMNDRRNGNQYTYMADFEQAQAILEVGHALTKKLAATLEIPYAYRSGGSLDQFIDGFHVFIGNRRFNRQYYPRFQNIYSVKTNGTQYYTEDRLADGVANLKLKLKYWLVPWMGRQKGSCACGIAVSSQTKFPVMDAKSGGTTGDIDQSFLLHIGVPLYTASSMLLTAGYTFLGDNPAMKDWPRFTKSILYEGAFDMAVDDHWGILLNIRAESPFLNVRHLSYFDTSTNPDIVSRNRAASGWNSLVRWRGTESLGIRYRTASGSQTQFSIAEDWGIGPYDEKDNIYSNNASDVNFILQTQVNW